MIALLLHTEDCDGLEQSRNLEFVVPCQGRVCGVKAELPGSSSIRASRCCASAVKS